MAGKWLRSTGFAFASVGIVACGDGGTEPPGGVPVARIEVSPADSAVDVESDFALRVTAYDSAGRVVTGPQLSVTSNRTDVASATVVPGGAAVQLAVAANAIGTAQLTLTAPRTGGGTLASRTVQIRVRPKVIVLEPPAGATMLEAYGVNDAGVVIGWLPELQRGWVYSPARGGRVLTGLTPDGVTFAAGINASGIIVGNSDIPSVDLPSGDTEAHLVTWDAEDHLSDKGLLGGTDAVAYAINARGQVLFSRAVPANSDSATKGVLEPDGRITFLGRLDGHELGPAAIDDDGTVVGTVSGTGWPFRSFVWTPAGGPVAFAPISDALVAQGVARGPRIVGWFELVGGVPPTDHAFYWSPVDGWLDIEPLPGDLASSASAINERGQVVGISGDSDHHRAFLWTKTDGLVDLGAALKDLGYDGSTRANAISPGGIVAGGLALKPGIDMHRAVLWITRRRAQT
jgi:probable HAF family extracellular repeat protein